MINYVIETNPDDRILKKVRDSLESSGLICFPTETNWIVACLPDKKDAVDKLYKLKHESVSKHFSLLCPNIKRASELAVISDHAFRVLKKKIPGCYTFIFEARKHLSKVLKATKADKEVGIRFSPSTITQKILDFLDTPLISTNLTREVLEIAEDQEIYSYLIEEKLSHLINEIIDPGEVVFTGSSTIIKFIDNSIEIIREGAGDLQGIV
jgi:tRNA threonylcarbamoyl adenosine modification protein (Sua5/YciO/YrdC/YwlC family)